MAQFRSSADLMDLALTNAGEVINGNSPYDSSGQLLGYLNRVHMAIVSGGTIPLGKDQTVEIDEVWPWSRSRRPLILELQPAVSTGTITLTQGSESGSFSSAPASSLAGWYIRVRGRSGVFRIASHTAAATAFELDGAYPDDSGAGFSFTCFKLDYELVPSFIVIDKTNDKFQFQKAASSPLTATLTHGTYSPATLITHVATVATTAAAGPVITGAYSEVTKKFSLTSDLAGPTIFQIIGNGSESEFGTHRILGFDDETTSAAATQTSVYTLGGIARLIEPMKINGGSVFAVDEERFQRSYPLDLIGEGQPDRFCIIRETDDGSLSIRFNSYPSTKLRVEVEHVPVPRDLKDNSSSVPLVPRKDSDVLEYAATFFLMFAKSDDRAATYANLLQGKLKAMIAQNRGSQQRAGENFAQFVPRLDLLPRKRGPIFGGPT